MLESLKLLSLITSLTLIELTSGVKLFTISDSVSLNESHVSAIAKQSKPLSITNS